MKPRGRAEPLVLLAAGAVLLAASGIHPRDRLLLVDLVAGENRRQVLHTHRLPEDLRETVA
jgi:hypothetical protein